MEQQRRLWGRGYRIKTLGGDRAEHTATNEADRECGSSKYPGERSRGRIVSIRSSRGGSRYVDSYSQAKLEGFSRYHEHHVVWKTRRKRERHYSRGW